MKMFDKIVHGISVALDYTACAFLFFMMAFVTVYVIVRACGYAIFGTYEIVQLCSLLVVSFSLMHNEYDCGNITIDFLDNYLGKAGKKALMIFSLLVTFAITSISAYRMIFFMQEKIADASTTANLQIPVSVFILIMAITFIMLALCALFKLIATIVGYDYKKTGAESNDAPVV